MNDTAAKIEISDCHVHVGRFRDLYFSPKMVASLMKRLGIRRALVMSSTGAISWRKAEDELKELGCIHGDGIHTGLWLNKDIIGCSSRFYARLKHGYSFIKFHVRLYGWSPSGRNIRRAFQYAYDTGLPLMIHTGEDSICSARAYERLCAEYPAVKVIFAHGRPLSQAAYMIKKYDNAYLDTAFMPLQHILRLKKESLMDKVLFGSDIPIDSYFYREGSIEDRYGKVLSSMLRKLGEKEFEKIVSKNFKKIVSRETQHE